MPTKFKPDTAHYRRPSITAFNRLIPNPISIDYERNLRAEIHDPLWLLARQWQMGEFKGEDAGSPAFARVESSQTQPTNLRIDPNLNRSAETYNYKQTPLEAVVEREKVQATVHVRIQAGFYFQKLMKLRRFAQFLPFFIENYPLPMQDLPSWDTAAQSLLLSTRGQIADGLMILDDLKSVKAGETMSRLENWMRAKPTMTPSVPDLLLLVKDLDKWLTRTYSTLATNSEDAKPKAWKQEQLAYNLSFEMTNAAATPPQTVKLKSDNYTDGQLDWGDFTWSGESVLPNATVKGETFIPTAVRYQGMPRPRFWEMEEGRVNFGAVSTSPNNVLAMAFTEFGLAYSNDWFWIPMPLKINTLCRINTLVVTNVFGDKTTYQPQPTAATDPLSIFSLYQLFDADKNTMQPILYLPPTISKVQEAEPLERVYFLRDELSNLAWAVETIAPSAAQTGIEMKTTTPESNEPNENPVGLIYKLGNIVPENWTPFLPVRINNTAQTRLQRAQMPGSLPPKGQILQDTKLREKPYFIREEEVNRAGIVVERSWQRTRWLNGKTFTWIGRRKSSGRIENTSNLRWDWVLQK